MEGKFCETPKTIGLSAVPLTELETGSEAGSHATLIKDKDKLFDWLGRYLDLTTYEISCPVLRDPDPAPEGKTGLIISSLMDYGLVRHFRNLGWYEELRDFCANRIVDILDDAISPGIKTALIDSFTSPPLTIETVTGNTDGAITGWAFTNNVMPAVNRLPLIARSALRPIPDILQAGQWTFSLSGLPISILTGKLADDRIVKDLPKSTN